MLKNTTWIIPQIKNHKKSHELRLIDHRHKTKIQNMCTVFKFLTPSMEKTVNIYGFK